VTCNLCGSADHSLLYEMPDRHYFRQEAFQIVKCNQCELGFVNPRPTLSEIQKYYPQEYYARISQDPRRLMRRFTNQAKYLREIEDRGKSKDLLDLGCAGGDFPRFMMARGWKVEGVEVSKASGRISDFTVYNQQFSDIPVQGSKYDAVTAWAVMEHVHDPMAYFQKASIVCKKGGLFVFETPNFRSLASRYLFCEDVPRHLYFFDEQTVRRYLEATGFWLVRARYGNDVYETNSVNWLRFLIKTRIKRQQFYFRDRHLTREEYCLMNNRRRGLPTTLRYAISTPVALVEQLLMPLITRFQIWQKTFGECTYVARKL
jgi:2-polyprenyl-3-methyl-5-hydroxy-6-metoxy-1,4-benzoquinol methylase